MDLITSAYQDLLRRIDVILKQHDVRSSPEIVLYLFVCVIALVIVMLTSGSPKGDSGDEVEQRRATEQQETVQSNPPRKQEEEKKPEEKKASSPPVVVESPPKKEDLNVSTTSSPGKLGSLHRGKLKKSGVFFGKSTKFVEIIRPPEDPKYILLVHGFIQAGGATGSPDPKRSKNMWLNKYSFIVPKKDRLSFVVNQSSARDSDREEFHAANEAEFDEWVEKIQSALSDLSNA